MPATLELPAETAAFPRKESIRRTEASSRRAPVVPLWISMSVGIMATSLCLATLLAVWPSLLFRFQFSGTGDFVFNAVMIRFGLTVLAFLALTSLVFHVGAHVVLRKAADPIES